MTKVPDPLKCSFCGKTQHQVQKIIVGPDCYICDECIYLCVEILQDENIAKAVFAENDEYWYQSASGTLLRRHRTKTSRWASIVPCKTYAESGFIYEALSQIHTAFFSSASKTHTNILSRKAMKN